jgi:hypothetical protein
MADDDDRLAFGELLRRRFLGRRMTPALSPRWREQREERDRQEREERERQEREAQEGKTA